MNYIQKYKAALKLNRWPMIDYVKQAEDEQQNRINRLYPKKWRKFEKPISVLAGTHVPPVGIIITEYYHDEKKKKYN